ncbi:hypothetical protein KC678_04020 [Candidatus Dojkabacteria bacterium]|uniref:Uncharacterized protein n=1 Tax=Candidatus Dojkabacteria bacterium TaxID=2099670 RepID=A0A955L2A3_9BACT|nr:hypothetical protein [Candidatus Dojkabacteria bacterium]
MDNIKTIDNNGIVETAERGESSIEFHMQFNSTADIKRLVRNSPWGNRSDDFLHLLVTLSKLDEPIETLSDQDKLSSCLQQFNKEDISTQTINELNLLIGNAEVYFNDPKLVLIHIFGAFMFEQSIEYYRGDESLLVKNFNSAIEKLYACIKAYDLNKVPPEVQEFATDNELQEKYLARTFSTFATYFFSVLKRSMYTISYQNEFDMPNIAPRDISRINTYRLWIANPKNSNLSLDEQQVRLKLEHSDLVWSNTIMGKLATIFPQGFMEEEIFVMPDDIEVILLNKQARIRFFDVLRESDKYQIFLQILNEQYVNNRTFREMEDEGLIQGKNGTLKKSMIGRYALQLKHIASQLLEGTEEEEEIEEEKQVIPIDIVEYALSVPDVAKELEELLKFDRVLYSIYREYYINNHTYQEIGDLELVIGRKGNPLSAGTIAQYIEQIRGKAKKVLMRGGIIEG